LRANDDALIRSAASNPTEFFARLTAAPVDLSPLNTAYKERVIAVETAIDQFGLPCTPVPGSAGAGHHRPT
jgi:hypothetical protein